MDTNQDKKNLLEMDCSRCQCLRDLKMDLARENFDKGQIGRKEFEQAILDADKVCDRCEDPVCREAK